MKKVFLYHLSMIVIPIAVLVLGMNYFIDPGNVFSGRAYVAGISNILLQGHNVDKVANYDERDLQERMVTGLSWRPDIVVLGSSRIMELGSDFFPGSRLLNCGVSHANINDVLAVTGLLDSLDRLPQQVVINLDPHLLSLGGTSEWQSLTAYRNHFLSRIHSAGSVDTRSLILNKFYTLVSFEYFEKSLNFILQHKTKHYRDVGIDRPSAYGRYSDGTICYPAEYAFPDTMKVASDARITGSREEMTLDVEKLKQLNALLDFLASRKVHVRFVMLPYHPQYYQMLEKRHPNTFSSYDSLFRKIARERNIPIHGGFDANRMGIPEGEFYDSWHCNKEAIKTVLNYN
jgi:hypothetical protein